MNTDENKGNLTYFPVEKRKRECSGEARSALTDEEATISGEVLLRTIEEPFESEGRSRRIARLRKKILDGTYYIPAAELAERMIDGDNF